MVERCLILVRHADAASNGADLHRPLSERGRGDAAAIGRWLAANAAPDLVVVSPARRAQQTWDLAAAQLEDPPPVSTDTRIYDNTVDDIIDVIRECPASATGLAVVGHNPSMQALSGAGFPTASLAVIRYDGEWSDYDPASAPVAEVITCRGSL